MFCQHSFKIKDTLWRAYNSRQMQLRAFFFLFYTTLHKVRGSGNVWQIWKEVLCPAALIESQDLDIKITQGQPHLQ